MIDAKRAGLWTRPIWQTYPRRMLQMRARSFALRDAFPDVLKGLISVEEARDLPATSDRLPDSRTVDAAPDTPTTPTPPVTVLPIHEPASAPATTTKTTDGTADATASERESSQRIGLSSASYFGQPGSGTASLLVAP